MNGALAAGTATLNHDTRLGAAAILLALVIGVPVWWKWATRYRPGGWSAREMRQIHRDDPYYQERARRRRGR